MQFLAVDRNFYYYLAVDWKFKKAKNTIITTFNLVQKDASSFLAQDQKFLKPKIPLLELLT
jgi:hypothetical protein